ncbi:MAG: hypothetical protein A2509_03090 [Candidatus Edwardsbacteria bacterium RIFOXYD12_FULL_50_11]|uniref:Phospholipase C/D domain-containing protein n=1 Tax=Candidatus Edwardsbacteria bacterium GWF2_54_11 TaxID=1817851 RepID=A0A1F5RIM6_9BACT|nr:MAG: hypothetical protein A2502_06955 [Candidatus Edwardsbacteria bacterium RifOxyC12_full_54_24]OGF06966.1 MAG: hypothetical protein A2273_08475 [Candidatus Edwardsbacteria bacterium RifOxyA12_full_54_48]OGF11068.1 MAG: hypothetical protein A3K15_08035 [Candidatus Edwardsbacteria bacterium GWE2_54_12]OGF14033.1 MAG: hypothetical protein A2024_05730 [Candidatus Edwardsbacteria bacterium GWF2_54_11]OGF16014.1 MAG: hypothetical protein A2509_03090 [Candidatus Edwardsbacteria bacterium RIFOXYD1
MPIKKYHEEFDLFLSSKGVLLPDGQYGVVHTFMDKGVGSFGANHRELDIYHREEGLRSWLNGKYNVIGQHRATDWLRAGLGHICLDVVESNLPNKYTWDHVYEKAYQLMKRMRWNKSRFIFF